MNKKITISKLIKKYSNGEKITALTAYDYSMAKCLDEAGIDIILVGDSLAMVVLGYETTHSVTVEEMSIFTKAVSRGAKNSFIVADMPFLSYQISKEEATRNAGELIRAGAKAVKIEGASSFTLDTIKHLVESGIPVVGHLGFTPQFLHTLGGYNIQGRTWDNTLEILKQAQELEKCGVFSIVLEMVPSLAAKYITDNINVPTIGIGAGKDCSGQILVVDDILGKYSDFTPSFIRKYANLKEVITNAVSEYRKDVLEGNFPTEKESFGLKEEEAKFFNDASNKKDI